MTPGNISRRSRGDAKRKHNPAALRVSVTDDGYATEYVEIPHKPAEEVFHPAVIPDPVSSGQSQFVQGLKEMKLRKTDTGAGLLEFLEHNLDQFEDSVAEEIMILAQEVDHD